MEGALRVAKAGVHVAMIHLMCPVADVYRSRFLYKYWLLIRHLDGAVVVLHRHGRISDVDRAIDSASIDALEIPRFRQVRASEFDVIRIPDAAAQATDGPSFTRSRSRVADSGDRLTIALFGKSRISVRTRK